jgi:uncharacterized protein
MLNIYIDADACPVKDETYKVAARYQLKIFVVSNSNMSVPFHPSLTFIKVGAGADVADDWIAEHIGQDDICITGDIPLADRCLKKSARVLSFRGEEFDEEMIGSAMATRELMKNLREAGQIMGGPSTMEKSDRSQFLNSLDRIIQALKRKNTK